MDITAEIRPRHLIRHESIRAIARDLKLSRPTVHDDCASGHSAPQPQTKLGRFQSIREQWQETERHLPKALRRTLQRLFEGLQTKDYPGAYDSIIWMLIDNLNPLARLTLG